MARPKSAILKDRSDAGDRRDWDRADGLDAELEQMADSPPAGTILAGNAPGDVRPPLLNWGGSFISEEAEHALARKMHDVIARHVVPYKLDLGCGQNKRGPEWIGVDTHEAAEVQGPMWAVPLPSNSAGELYSSHALEHARKAEVIPTLKEWRRLARKDATLTLRVPDLEWCVRNWLATGMGNGWELDTIFGSQEHEGNCHRTGFTRPMLHFYLAQAGWEVVSERTIESHGQPTIEVVCLCV